MKNMPDNSAKERRDIWIYFAVCVALIVFIKILEALS